MREKGAIRSFLESPRRYEAEARLKGQRARELEERCKRVTAAFSDMPRGGTADRGELLAMWADARTEEVKAVRRAEEQRSRVEKLLAGIEDPVGREILMLRYVFVHRVTRRYTGRKGRGYWCAEKEWNLKHLSRGEREVTPRMSASRSFCRIALSRAR